MIKYYIKPLIVFVVLIISSNNYAGNWENKTFESKVFIENLGQFDKKSNSIGTRIKYYAENQGCQIYFTTKGISYRFDKYEKLPQKKKGDPGKSKKQKPIKTHLVNVEWLNANPNVKLVGENIAKEYFTYNNFLEEGKSINHAAAYTKVVYQNLYQNIDVEYIFHPKEGIKYNIILYPGADPSVIKMKYNGEEQAIIDVKGNLKIGMADFQILDHAPKTFYDQDKVVIQSKYHLLDDNTVAFELDNYDNSKKVIIDPWTTTTTNLVSNNRAFDVGKDAAGNVYIAGGTGAWPDGYRLAKYTAAGALVWTANTGLDGYYGDMVVDAAGNCYIAEGAFLGRFKKFDSSGASAWSTTVHSGPGGYETWALAVNDAGTSVVISWLDNGYNIGIANVNMATGATSGATNMGVSKEIRSLCFDPAGNIHGLTCSNVGNGSSGNYVFGGTNALTPVYSAASGYSWDEISTLYSTTNNYTGSGVNGICADNNFVYTTNGAVLQQRNISTGAIINSVAIPGGVFERNGGVVVNDCGSIYVGSRTGVYEFDNTLTQTNFMATSNDVYDVKMGSASGEVLACGRNFVTSLSFAPCCLNPPTVLLPSTSSSTCVSIPVTINGNTFGGSATSVTITEDGAGAVSPTSSNSSPFGFTYTPAAGDVGNTVIITVTTDNPNGAPCAADVETYTLTVNPLITGTLDSTICNGASFVFNGTTYDSGNLSGTETLTAANGCDSVVAVTVTELSLITGVLDSTICNGASFVFNGTTYDSGNLSGLETQTAANGCDSVVTVTVTELPLITGVLDSTICNGASFVFNGTTYDNGNLSGTETLTAANGCDSVVTVTVTESPLITGVLDSTICNGGSVVFNGTTYDSGNLSGSETLTAANGCDSVVTVTITESLLIRGTLDSTICNGGSVVFNGTTYDSGNLSGLETLTAANGCDSVVTVTVTELPLITGTLDSTICNGASFVFNGTTYNSGNLSGTATLTAANGCDSVVTVTVTELPLITGVLDSTICNGASFVFNGTTYDSGNLSGTETLTAANGCDSIVTVTASELPVKTGLVNNTICTYDSVIVNGVTYNASNPTGTEVFNNVGPYNCDSTVTINLTITPDPVISISSATECENITGSGQALNIDVTAIGVSINGSGSFTWYTDNTYSTIYTPTNETVDSGEVFYYEVIVNGCMVQDSILYNVSGNITLNDPMPELCEDVAGGGTVANVDISIYQNGVFPGATTYDWQGVLDSTSVLISDGDSIQIEVTQGSCPTVDIFVHFTVNPIPTSAPTSLEMCEDAVGSGQSSFDLTSLDNTINGGTADAVTWFDDAATSSPIGTPGTYVSGNATVYAMVTNATTLCSDTAEVTLIVNPLPVSNPAALELCDEGSSQATFDLTSLDNAINGGTADAVTWFTDAATTGSIATPGTYTTGSTTVYALVANATTLCTDTAEVILTVNPLPTVVNTTYNLCDEGAGTATFDLTSVENTVNGGTANVVTWFDDALATTPIVTPGVFVTGNDTVYAVVTDASTLCMDTTDVYLVVDTLPTAQDQTPQLCEDAGTPGVVAGVDLTLLNGAIEGGAGSTLTWYNDTLLTSPVATPTNATVTDGQVFFVEVDNGTCLTIAKVTYTVTSTITLTDPAAVLCEDSFGSNSVANVDLTSYNTSVYAGVAPVYVWYQDAGMTIAVVNVTDTTITGPTMTLYVDVTDGTCNNNTAVTFTVNPQSVGVLDSTVCNGGSVVFNGTTYSAATSLTGTEILISANNCDSVVTVTVIELPLLADVHNETVCDGGSIVVNGTTYDSSNLTGTEVFTNIGPNGCDSTVTVTLTILAPLTGIHNETVCDGGSIVVNGTTYDSSNLTGTEVFTNIGPNACDSTVTVTLTILAPLTGIHNETVCDGGSIVVNGTTYDSSNLTGTEVFTNVGPNACDSTVTVTLTILAPLADVYNETVCDGGSIVVNGTTYDASNPSGVEVFTNVGPNSCDSTVTVNLTVLPALNGSVTDTICSTESVIVNGTTYDANNLSGTEVFTNIGPNNCDSTVTIDLTLIPDLIAFFTATPSSGIIPLLVTFDETGSSTGAGVVYTWDYGNGTGAVGNTPTTTFNDLGTYDVELTVSDGNSCGVATYMVTIEVLGESVILIPNVFTPNGDGSNDVFTVTGTNLESVEGEIYNRWGQKMFEWNNVKGYWNGRTLSGSEAPDGTYFYIITAKGIDNVEYFKKGGFSLIR